jgi:hypothetical protein
MTCAHNYQCHNACIKCINNINIFVIRIYPQLANNYYYTLQLHIRVNILLFK